MSRISFIDKLHETALTDGSRTAVVYDCGISSMSYAELDRLSSRIADKLSSSGIGPGDAVTVMMHRNALSVAAEAGVLKAGAVFVPVLPSSPEDRISYIMEDCGSALLIDENFYDDLADHNGDFKAAAPLSDLS